MHDSYFEMIFKRKSFHLFRNIGNEKMSARELDEIKETYKSLTALCPDIETKIRIVPATDTDCNRGEEYCILFYSEEKDDYLQNIGYLGEQLDLYLVSKNIGTLWFGIGDAKETESEGLHFVIMMAIAKINDENKFRKDMYKSKRKTVDEIWNGTLLEGVTDIVRFAPSACNTQPWSVNRDENEIKVYRYRKSGKRGIMPADKVSYFNRIDIGIFLCFMELCFEHNGITASRKLLTDNGTDEEMTLNAVYRIEYIRK